LTEWERHKLLLSSEAKAAKTQNMMATKWGLEKQRWLLAIKVQFEKEQLEEMMRSIKKTATGPEDSAGVKNVIVRRPSRTMTNSGAL
jgi:hypothetical protein